METITCRRCGTEDAESLERPPFKSQLGNRIKTEICAACWKEWLVHQTRLINHYGLDVRDPEARDFLYAQVDQALFGTGDARQVDTSQEGQVEW
jgi:Fe-S cluster biosynthesis and repair protein YggX